MPRTRGIGDYIPAKGEARVLAELKGSYGSKTKGRRMARTRGRRPNRKNPKVQWSLMETFPDADATRYIIPFRGQATGLNTGIERLAWWCPLTPARLAGTAQPITELNAKLLRIIVEMGLSAQISEQIASGTVQRSGASARQLGTLPFNNIAEGAFDASLDMAATSNVEGVFFRWWWVYETDEDAGASAFSVFNPFAVDEYTKNRRVFDSGLEAVALYKPMVKRFDKKFRVPLNSGDRENWQVALYGQVLMNRPTDTPDPLQPFIGYTFGVSRAQYAIP